jgi:hypothetical protein
MVRKNKENIYEKSGDCSFVRPESGFGRIVGAFIQRLAAVYDFKQRGADVQLLFQGAGTRWAGELVNREHPAYQLFASVKDKVAGVSCGCATFSARAKERSNAGLI